MSNEIDELKRALEDATAQREVDARTVAAAAALNAELTRERDEARAALAGLHEWPCENDDCDHALADVVAHDASHPNPTSGGAWFCARCWNAALGKLVAERDRAIGEVAALREALRLANDILRRRVAEYSSEFAPISAALASTSLAAEYEARIRVDERAKIGEWSGSKEEAFHEGRLEGVIGCVRHVKGENSFQPLLEVPLAEHDELVRAEARRAALEAKALREMLVVAVNRATGLRDTFRCEESEALVDGVLKHFATPPAEPEGRP